MEASEFRPRTDGFSKPTENSKRERLPDEEMGNLISAIGNHEAKALTLGLMEPEHIYSSGDIHRRIIGAQGNSAGWKMNQRGPFNYCQFSLAPVGLVAQELMDSDLKTTGFMKTRKGEVEGDALAGLILDFSLKYPEFSVQDFFGGTPSSSKVQETSEGIEYKKRAPMTRIKIFWELLSSELPARKADFVNKIGESPETIQTHLRALGDAKIISYESVGHDKPYTYYKASEDAPIEPPEPFKKYATMTSFVYGLLRDNPDREWTADDVAEEILKSPNFHASQEYATHYSSNVMNYLKQKGYVERRKFGEDLMSEINLNDNQKNMIFDLINMLNNFQNQESSALVFGKRRLQEILGDPELVSKLMTKAKEHSSKANRTPHEELLGRILTIVSAKSNPTGREVQEVLLSEGKRLNIGKVQDLLRILSSDGRLEKYIQRGVSHYRTSSTVDSNS